MALTTNITITPASGSPVSLHGWSGVIHPAVTVGEGFRRPGASGRNYQTTGKEAPPSTLDVWFVAATEPALAALRDALIACCWKQCGISRTNRTSARAVITSVDIITERRTSGSALWRCEAKITLEAMA